MKLKEYFLISMLLCILSFHAQNYKSLDQVNGLSVGDQVDHLNLQLLQNKKTSLDKLLEHNEYLVMVFYRGQWCPVCNKHLSMLNERYTDIKEYDAELIAISPEKPDYQAKTQEKTGAQFLLAYDKNFQISKTFDALYQPNGAKRTMYNVALGAHLKKAHSDKSQRLPVPATFILNKYREIIWRQFDRDYKNRSTAKQILNALQDA